METSCIFASLSSILCSPSFPKSCRTVPVAAERGKVNRAPVMQPSSSPLQEVKNAPIVQLVSPLQTSGSLKKIHTVTSLYPPFSYTDAVIKSCSSKEPEICTLNSYKYGKPRICVKNTFPNTEKARSIFFMILLWNWVQRIGLTITMNISICYFQ